MSEQKCGALILDAIDQLRKRKARPDLDRICHMLERRHGLKSAAVNEELSRLVNEGIVIKVDYKGNTSYRNAAKWVKTKSQFNGSYYNSSDISSVIVEAIRIITLPSKEQPQLRSASLLDIEQFLLKKDSQFNINHATLRAILEKEVSKGTLHLLTSGEYVLLKTNPTFEICKKTDGEPLPKQIKIDPVYQENSSNSNDEPIPVRCDYCLLTAAANRKGEAEELLVCKDCGAKAHPSCMEYTKLLYESYPQPQNWQCPDCKTCIVCEETASSDDLLTCSICFKGFHMACHDPPVTTKTSGIWLCCDCDTNSKEMGKSKKANIKNEFHQYDDEFEPHVIKDEFIKSIEQYPSNVPLAKEWSIENVETFFKYIGFEDEAPAFREQEIDGMSLLLMKRLDVLTGLGIKLGPALKIYKHVIKLQSRIDDN